MKTSKSIEKNLQKVLDRYRLSQRLTVEMVKNWVFYDDGDSALDASNRFQKKWFKYFVKVKNIDELNDIMQVFVDAWNTFPHKSLGGKSPSQIMYKALKRDADFKNKSQKMPDVIVGGQKMSWDEYWAMIRVMEKVQIPFKNWVAKDLLPKYRQFLQADLGIKAMKKHMEVADIFFERAMHLGFIEFDQLRKNFVQEEFPKWWQTHVLMSGLSEKEVLSSLQKLFQFISFEYRKDIKKFGF
jgi:hypothetical protein